MSKPLKDIFAAAVAYVIKNEIGSDPDDDGGFSLDEVDRGGATRWGITIGTLSRWRTRRCTIEDVVNLTKEEAIEIYRTWYWFPTSCHLIRNPQIAISIMDMGVLFGATTSARNAQLATRPCGYPRLMVDGLIGPQSINALNTVNGTVWCVNFQKLFFDRVTGIIKDDETQVKYRRGWENRIAKLKTLG